MVRTQPQRPPPPPTIPQETRHYTTLALSSCAKMHLRSSDRMTFQVETNEAGIRKLFRDTRPLFVEPFLRTAEKARLVKFPAGVGVELNIPHLPHLMNFTTADIGE